MSAAPAPHSNDYSIEIFQGPLLAPIAVMGVGGAYIASAENIEGSAVNAAAPAVRNPFSTDWFDLDINVSVSFPGAFAKGPFANDFSNRGDDQSLAPSHATTGDFLSVNTGSMVQFGAAGVATTVDLEQYSLSSPGTAAFTLQIARSRAVAGYAILGGQLVLGGGARILTMQIQQAGVGTLVRMVGAAPEVGALVMPTGQPWRIGATVRAAVSGGGGLFSIENSTVDANGVRSAGGYVVPSHVVMPWEAELGIAYQVGPRPLNPGWEDPNDQQRVLTSRIAHERAERQRDYREELERLSPEGRRERIIEQHAEEKSLRAIEDDHIDEDADRLRAVRNARYANWPRERILLLASLLVTGSSANATSFEGFLDKQLEPVGRRVSLTPRFGLEGEPLPNRMLLRVGSYIEPSRYDGGSARQHFTFGTDIFLFPFDFLGLFPKANLKLGLFVDLAPRYTNWGIGLGNWH